MWIGDIGGRVAAYTERHWARADRTLIEASMVEYSVQAMDTLLGVGDEDDGEEEGEGVEGTFGELLEMDEDSEEDEDDDMSD